VDELHGARHRQRVFDWIPFISGALGPVGAPHGVGGGERKNRPQTLPASKYGVPESVAENRGTRWGSGQIGFEGRFNPPAVFIEERVKRPGPGHLSAALAVL
jgi:hypothetical protein